MKKKIENAVLGATGRALATSGPAGLNVVPVSAAHVINEAIHLFDFFMNKTVVNIKQNPHAALACWDGLAGVQIKAIAEYITEGEVFAAADAWAKETYPDRTLRGLIVLHPLECYSVSPLENPGTVIALQD
jgi:predicted pyridoxine 5'-phosphate oxidase superfamily flavin-nucleotide-binding protein